MMIIINNIEWLKWWWQLSKNNDGSKDEIQNQSIMIGSIMSQTIL